MLGALKSWQGSDSLCGKRVLNISQVSSNSEQAEQIMLFVEIISSKHGPNKCLQASRRLQLHLVLLLPARVFLQDNKAF